MPKNIQKVYSAPKVVEGKYQQTAYKADVATGVKIRDDIWAGEIHGTLDDPERIKNLKAVDLSSSSKNKTVGRNKSGCLWKKSTSLRSGRLNVSIPRKSVEERLKERKEKKAL